VRDAHPTTRVEHARIELPFVPLVFNRLEVGQEFVVLEAFEGDQRQAFKLRAPSANAPGELCGRRSDVERNPLARSMRASLIGGLPSEESAGSLYGQTKRCRAGLPGGVQFPHPPDCLAAVPQRSGMPFQFLSS
jgi:hypothetical protein